MRFAVVLLVAVVSAIAVPLPAAPAAAATLEAVVLLSRHGVRSPNVPADELAQTAADPWPDFGVPEGYLTPRGRKLARLMGQYYGAYYRKAGLLPATGCPASAQVYLRADDMQRTLETARALSKGMLPGCDYPIRRVTKGADPLIDPQGAGICPIDDDDAEAAELAAVGGSWAPVVDAYRASLADLQDTLECCGPKLCAAYGLKAGCTLLDLPAGADSAGPVDIATLTGEILIMEYADGMPMSDVGWGRAPASGLGFLNMSHALAFWASNANPYMAGRAGSNLLSFVQSRLKAASGGTGPKLSVIVAHDNNLLNIAGLLRAGWFIDSYQQNQVPPGAAIAFELWRDGGAGRQFVRVVYRAQTLGQLRKASKLTLAAPPATVDLSAAVCGPEGAARGCPDATFLKTVSDALVGQCVAGGSSGGSSVHAGR